MLMYGLQHYLHSKTNSNMYYAHKVNTFSVIISKNHNKIRSLLELSCLNVDRSVEMSFHQVASPPSKQKILKIIIWFPYHFRN